MNSGKKTKYIDSNNFVGNVKEEYYSYDNIYSEIPDTIRYFSKNYWTLDNGLLTNANKNKSNIMFEVVKIDDNTFELTANKTKFLSDSINDRGILERKFNKELWEQYLELAIPSQNTIFEDFNIGFPEPKNISEEKDTKVSGLNFINREFVYNFYSKNYENLLKDRRLDVTSLPNMFALINDPKLGTRTYEENLVLTLGGLIPDNYAESLFLAREESQLLHNYFNKYSEVYTDPDASTVVLTLANLYSFVKVNKNKVSSLKKINYIPFPFYVTAKFSNLANKKANFIHELERLGGTAQDLLNYLVYEPTSPSTKNFIYNSDISEDSELKYYDLKDWLNLGLQGNIGYNQTDDSAILERSTKTIPQVEYASVLQYIKDNLKNKTRKYEDFMDKESLFEPLFYKIEKRMFNYDRAKPIQTFWVSPDDGDLVKFIDTQVKYGTEYYYTISCYALIVGNEYRYERFDYSSREELRLEDIANGKYKIKIINKPSYKIIEIPYARFDGVIHEEPYTKPSLKIEKDGEYIRFNIKQSAEETLEQFEIVENEDFKLFESIRVSQDNTETDKIKSIRNTSTSVDMQIYRTTIKPINYLSFQGKLYKTVSLENTNSFIDSLVPEIKYYYMFRYLNKHSVPSNASNVYELEIKDEGGYRYLIVKELDLNKGAEKTSTKDLKRYLLIRPSTIQQEQKLVEKIETPYDVILGPDKGKAWGKKFILRLTSKKTNRIIELNITPTINRQKQ